VIVLGLGLRGSKFEFSPRKKMISPSGQNRQKAVWRSAFLGLKTQCYIVENTILQLFRRFCPLG